MIPADNFLLSDDGTTALWVNDAPGAANTTTLNRPCETTYTDLQERFGDPYVRCPDCDGTGRHTFTIEVECTGKLVEVTDNGRFGLSCDGGCGKEYPWGTLTFTVHVFDVLPIVDENDAMNGPGIPRRCIIYRSPTEAWFYGDADEGVERITLPPDAAPDMFAVSLDVHERNDR